MRFHDGIISVFCVFVVGDRAADCGHRPLHPAAAGFLLDLGDSVSLGGSADLYRGRGDSGRGAAAEFVSGFSAAAADSELERTILDNPSAGNYEELGLLYLDDGNFARARACYDKAISSRTDHADPFYRRGIAEIELGDFAAAVPDLERAVTSDPDYDFHRAKGLLAWAYAQTGTERQGRCDVSRGDADFDDLGDVLPLRAVSCSRRDGCAEAREWAQKILDKKPTMPGYLRRRERPWFRKASGLLGRLPA